MENVKIKEICETVPGHGSISYEEGCCLYNFAKEVLARTKELLPIVEIGAYAGRSTMCIAQAIKDSGVPVKVITIDISPGFVDSVVQWANVFGLADYIFTMVGNSHTMSLEGIANISMLFLDGDHGYESTKTDLERFAPKVIKDGFIVGHDFQSYEGVNKAFKEYFSSKSLKINTCGDFVSINNSVVNNMVYTINRPPSVLVLGHKGFLGSYLTKHLGADTVENAQGTYDYVINCIGKPSVEFCQENFAVSLESNVNVVRKMISDYPKSKIIHFSSYYVYDALGFCSEVSPTTNAYNYMRHKLESEQLVVAAHGLVFRLGKLFGKSDGKKQGKFTDYVLEHQEMIVDNVQFNPTSLKQVLRVINFERSTGALSGIFNLSNRGVTTHFAYATHINYLTGNAKKIYDIAKAERIFNNYGRFAMDCSKLEQFVPLTDWQVDLAEFIKEITDAG
jgi:dTDP-4-dehydrorhamnose reductase